MAMTDTVSVTQEDIDVAAAFFRDDRTGLATKFNLGHDPSPLLDALARHRHEAELRGIKLGLEAAAKVAENGRAVGASTSEREAVKAYGQSLASRLRALDPAVVQRGRPL
jgi:hypothetical protein